MTIVERRSGFVGQRACARSGARASALTYGWFQAAASNGWIAVAVLATLFFTGCASWLPQFARTPPVISKAEAPYPLRGLVDLVYSQTDTTTPVRLLMVHGIGRHDIGWGKDHYLDSFMQDPQAVAHGWSVKVALAPDPAVRWKIPALHAAAATAGAPADEIDYPAEGFAGVLRLYTVTDRDARTCVVVYELTWSPLTTPFKAWRFQNGNSSGFNDETIDRPSINQMVRQVLDENLSDAVLYARGFDNNIIGKTVTHALEAFYTGKYDPDQSDAGKTARHHAPTIFLTESLGSMILAESLNAHVRDLSAPEKAERRTELRDVVRNLRVVYMMANQIALLDMPSPDPSGAAIPGPQARDATAPASAPNQAHATFHAFAQTREDLIGPQSAVPHAPLLVAAFSDLYDVLSYRASPDSLPERQVQVDNFYPRNTDVYLWPFKIYEDPAGAHTTYGANADVRRIVMEGYPADGR